MEIFYKGLVFKTSEFGPPNDTGVYIVVVLDLENRNYRLCYIGSSVNIKSRVEQKNHPYIKLYNRMKRLCVVVAFLSVKIGYQELEKEMISHYRPLLNKQHKKLNNG